MGGRAGPTRCSRTREIYPRSIHAGAREPTVRSGGSPCESRCPAPPSVQQVSLLRLLNDLQPLKHGRGKLDGVFEPLWGALLLLGYRKGFYAFGPVVEGEDARPCAGRGLPVRPRSPPLAGPAERRTLPGVRCIPSRRRVAHRFDVVAVRIQDESPIVVGVVLGPQPRSAVFPPADT